MITIPKYTSKKKRKNYYKVYFRARPKDLKKVWKFLDKLINKLGNPFCRAKTGRPPKFAKNMRIYTKICILISFFDFTLDEIAGLLSLLAGKSLDRSNIDRWFQRFPEDFAHRVSAFLHLKMEKMFGYGDYIVDATKITTNEYEEVDFKGIPTWKLLVYGLHIIIQYFFKEGFLSIVCFEVADGRSHEAPIFREKLIPKAKFQKNRRMFGDKGFPSEDTFEELFKRKLIPQLCQKETTKSGFWTKKAQKLYNNNLRKQIRGLVEAVFGGMETETNNRTRFKLDITRKTYIALRAMTHQIRTYFRALEYQTLNLWFSFATTSFFSTVYSAVTYVTS